MEKLITAKVKLLVGRGRLLLWAKDRARPGCLAEWCWSFSTGHRIRVDLINESENETKPKIWKYCWMELDFGSECHVHATSESCVVGVDDDEYWLDVVALK